ncbi:MAG: ArsR/SmtB family transcription factor [Candidatus Helarchaeota archaeon]
MNSKIIIENFPKDFELTIKALGNVIRLKISLILIEKGDLYLSEISKLICKRRSNILNHLRKLELAGIVQNYLKRVKGSKEYSFYKITRYGKMILFNLINSYINFHKLLKISKTLEFNKDIPEDFILILNAISNALRFQIATQLLENSYSFSEIAEIFKLKNVSVKNHLNKLEVAGLVQNYFKKNTDSNNYSYYKLTDLGNKIVEGLINSYNEYYTSKEYLVKKVELKEKDNLNEYFMAG